MEWNGMESNGIESNRIESNRCIPIPKELNGFFA